jgi:hypothetical protein
MSLTVLPGRMFYLETEEGGGVPLDDPPALPKMMSHPGDQGEKEILLMNLKMLPERISCLEAEEGGGVPLDDPSVLPEMMSYLEPKEGGGDPLDEPHNASPEDILPGG